MLKSLIQAWRRCSKRGSANASMYNPQIGEGTRIARSNLDGMFPHLIRVGRNCIVAPTAMILSHDASYYLHTGEYRVAGVEIGDGVFIGYGAIIMPGVKIGNRVVIGAGSVVTRDVPDHCVVVGSPARRLCSTEEYIARRPIGAMFRPPFAGTSPKDISAEQVEAFRQVVDCALNEAQSGG